MQRIAKWRLITDDSNKDERRRTFRMKVGGGHLYRYEVDVPVSVSTRQIFETMVFVPANGLRKKGH